MVWIAIAILEYASFFGMDSVERFPYTRGMSEMNNIA